MLLFDSRQTDRVASIQVDIYENRTFESGFNAIPSPILFLSDLIDADSSRRKAMRSEFFVSTGIFSGFPPPPNFGGKIGEKWWESYLLFSFLHATIRDQVTKSGIAMSKNAKGSGTTLVYVLLHESRWENLVVKFGKAFGGKLNCFSHHHHF